MHRAPLALIALLLFALAPASAGAATLTVIGPDGGQKPVLLDGIAPDVKNKNYPSRKNVTGVSVRKALSEGSVAQVDVDQVRVSGRADEGLTELTPEQIYTEKPTAVLVPKGGGLEVFTARGRELEGKGDLQATVTRDETPRPWQSNKANLKIRASNPRPKVGEAVRFTVTNGDPGATLSWLAAPKRGTADSLGKGREITHKFKRPGDYRVQVFNDESTRSGTINITVGKDASGASGGDGGQSAPPNTGRTAAGGAGRASEGSGAGSGAGAGAGGAPVGPGGVAPAAPIPPPTTAAPEAPTPSPTPRPTPSPTPTPAPTPAGQMVAGELLDAAAADAPPIPVEELAEQPTEQPEPEKNTLSLRIPREVWLFAGLVLLAAAGWRVDDRRARPSWS